MLYLVYIVNWIYLNVRVNVKGQGRKSRLCGALCECACSVSVNILNKYATKYI